MKLTFFLFFFPLFSTAQNNLPRYQNDTLYTSSGYNIYEGQVLHLAKGTSEAGYFRFIKFHYGMRRTDTYTLQNSTIVVKKLRNYKPAAMENYSIRVVGTATYKDNTQGEVDFIMDFEKATQSLAGQASELIIPEEYRNKQPVSIATETKKTPAAAAVKQQPELKDLEKMMVADEIKKLFDLYKAGALTKEEYEGRKKKLLEW